MKIGQIICVQEHTKLRKYLIYGRISRKCILMDSNCNKNDEMNIRVFAILKRISQNKCKITFITCLQGHAKITHLCEWLRQEISENSYYFMWLFNKFTFENTIGYFGIHKQCTGQFKTCQICSFLLRNLSWQLWRFWPNFSNQITILNILFLLLEYLNGNLSLTHKWICGLLILTKHVYL